MKFLLTFVCVIMLNACASGMEEIAGNENGSTPINQTEVVAYKKAVARCYKTGGSRIVKIDGHLRCF